VLTLDGMLSVKIPPGTQPNSKLSLRDKGVKHANRAGRQVRGVQYIIVKVDIPKHLTARQRELLHELAIEEGRLNYLQ
jgi:molecular chaperone DnaJ